MSVRSLPTSSILLAVFGLGCGAFGGGADGGVDLNPGCVGVCNPGSNTDGGLEARCAGVALDGGVLTLEALRTLPACRQAVILREVVVHTVRSKRSRVSQVTGGTQWQGDFWVGEPDGGRGIFVQKYFTDAPETYEPRVGDVVSVTGFLTELQDGRSQNPGSLHRDGYRRALTSAFAVDGGSARLEIGVLASGHPVRALAPSPSELGADGGRYAARPDLLGARVGLPGPLTLTHATPPSMLRYSRTDAGVVYLNASSADGGVRDVVNGFEVTGGVLVDDGATHASCPWRWVVSDGGTVVFPQGISGVWDTYTQVPEVECAIGPDYARCLEAGFIPGPDGRPVTRVLHVVIPTDCETDLSAN
jgi:hypothetical protein